MLEVVKRTDGPVGAGTRFDLRLDGVGWMNTEILQFHRPNRWTVTGRSRRPNVRFEDEAADAAHWRDQALPGYLGGPFGDRSGGLIIFHAPDRERAERLVSADPFVRQDLLANRWIKERTPEEPTVARAAPGASRPPSPRSARRRDPPWWPVPNVDVSGRPALGNGELARPVSAPVQAPRSSIGDGGEDHRRKGEESPHARQYLMHRVVESGFHAPGTHREERMEDQSDQG
jgi:hypothetical protein